ncbi:MAG: sulfatase-like hydrolase/transferase [Clostridium sp.]|nr:sulfatase-like hydrolase/transferase [Clostridium sp.]
MKKKINIFYWWVFWILFLEYIYRIFIIKDFFNINTLIVTVFSFIYITLFSFVTNVFCEKANKIITVFLTIIITFFTLAQIVYYNFYNSIFSFYSLTTGTGQVLHFWSMIVEVIVRIWYVFALILIPAILFIIFNNKIFEYKRNKGIILYTFIIGLIVSVLSSYVLIKKYDKGQLYSLNNLIYKTHAPMLTINKTGLLTMEVIDIYRYFFGFEENFDIKKDEVKNVSKKIEYNKLDIDFDKLIEESNDETIKSMHEYFSSLTPSEKNKYTGMFKGKNLIFITAEAFDTIAIDENITPTLYKIANNGFIFNNYYQPLYPVSTSDGEYMNVMSLIPKEGVWSFYKTSKNYMPFGIGNMFKKLDYNTYGFHNHNYNYYHREKSHTNIGLTYYGCGNGLEKKMNCKHWPNSDFEMIKATTPYYLNDDKPFMTYYMTVSGHLNYNFSGNNMASRNKSRVKNLNYRDSIKAYYATQIEFDKAIEELLNELEESGKLDDTLIVIAPDHYPYGLTTKDMNTVSRIDKTDKFENYHTSLIMYNPKIENKVVDKAISGIDILPTIYNLFGIDYDSRLLMGSDIFSNTEHIVILSDRSFITSKGKYNSITGEFSNPNVSKEYIDNINKIINEKFKMSSLILEKDYYKELGI